MVTLPDPISDQYTNFLDVYWFSAKHKDITIPYEQQLQFLALEPPHIQFHSWDALNPNPTSVFSAQAYVNGLLLFPPRSSFVDIVQSVSEAKPAAHKQTKSSKEVERARKGSRRSPASPPPQSKKQKSEDIKKQLLPVLEVLLEQVEGVPKQVHFLDSHGNWPLCRITKCKKQNKYAVYSEFSNKKPAIVVDVDRMTWFMSTTPT